jgi:signal transduction histidine kinase
MVGWSILVLGVILVAIGAVLYVSLNRTLMATVDAELKSASQSARRELEEAGGPSELQREGYQAGVLYLVVAPDGTVIANPQQVDLHALPTDLLDGQSAAYRTVTTGNDTIRLYAQPIVGAGGAPVTLVVGESLATEQAAAQQLMLTLLLCGAVGLALSFAGAWFLAARALVPIRDAFQRQQEFVADASHELRTPLTILHSAADVLASEPGQSNPGLVLEIRDEIQRMERLTRELLTLARADQGELQLSLGRVELGALADDLAHRVALLAESGRIQLVAHRPDRPVVVEGDPDRLQQVGLILLENALNHTPPGGSVSITVYEHHGAGAITVEDTGDGIPEDHRSRVFDRFHRVDPARTRGTAGTGLGLAIADALVSAHQGSISIGSGREGGTLVTVRLPLLASASLTLA